MEIVAPAGEDVFLEGAGYDDDIAIDVGRVLAVGFQQVNLNSGDDSLRIDDEIDCCLASRTLDDGVVRLSCPPLRFHRLTSMVKPLVASMALMGTSERSLSWCVVCGEPLSKLKMYWVPQRSLTLTVPQILPFSGLSMFMAAMDVTWASIRARFFVSGGKLVRSVPGRYWGEPWPYWGEP